MFSNYVYHSSVSKTFVKHCNDLAKRVETFFDAGKRLKVVDIASNDGCMLQAFKNKGHAVLGIEPAENLADEAERSGIPTLKVYWDAKAGESVKKMIGLVDIVTATNVFAHVDDIHEFTACVKTVLNERGIFIIEVPHIVEYLKHKEFDTTYHEHLSYLSLSSVSHVMSKNGLQVFHAERLPIHGGTIRVYSTHVNARKIRRSVARVLNEEKTSGVFTEETYVKFSRQVKEIIGMNRKLLLDLKRKGKTVAGFGASAKGTVLLNSIGAASKTLKYIVDDTADKQNKYVPNLGIRVVSRKHLEQHLPDYLFLTAWNFSDEIMKKTKDLDIKEGYIIPIPKPKIIRRRNT